MYINIYLKYYEKNYSLLFTLSTFTVDASFVAGASREFVHPIFFVFSGCEQCFADFVPDNKTK